MGYVIQCRKNIDCKRRPPHPLTHATVMTAFIGRSRHHQHHPLIPHKVSNATRLMHTPTTATPPSHTHHESTHTTRLLIPQNCNNNKKPPTPSTHMLLLSYTVSKCSNNAESNSKISSHATRLQANMRAVMAR